MLPAEAQGMLWQVVVIALVLISVGCGCLLLPDNVKEFFEML
jgi:hypothetical protein